MTGVLTSVTALLFSVAIVLIGHGLQLTLVPLFANSLGWSGATIGYLGSVYFAGFVVGCLTVPRLVANVGHIRVFGTLVSLATAALLLIGLAESVPVWLAARFLTGWSFAGLYMVIESWLNERSGTEFRGSVLSLYTVITLVAICTGQTLIGFDMTYMQMAMLGAVLISLGAIPVGLTRNPVPTPIQPVSFNLREVFNTSQVAVVGALLGGFVTGAFWTLGPIVATAQSLEADQVGLFMASAIMGGALFQYPVGKLSDRVDRRKVIMGVAVLGLVVSMLTPSLAEMGPHFLYLAMVLFGGSTFPLYSLCLAHANDNTSLGLMEVASVILLMNSAGSVVGPIVVSALLELTPFALFFVSAVMLSALTIWSAWRIHLHDVARRFFKPFANITKTAPTAAELIDEPQTPE